MLAEGTHAAMRRGVGGVVAEAEAALAELLGVEVSLCDG